MTIGRTGSNSYACVVNISGDASFNEFDNVIFSGRSGSTNLSQASLVVSEDNNSGNTDNVFNR